MNPEKQNLELTEIYDKLQKGIPIEDANIHEPINFEKVAWDFSNQIEHNVNVPITFKNCQIKSLWIANSTYTKRFILENFIFDDCNFFACYLLAGITFDNCIFKEDMFLFSGGGHNGRDEPIIIKNTIFCGLVDFSDAFFFGPVRISGCDFKAGTNLLGNIGHGESVKFDMPPEIIDTKGILDMQGSLFDWKGIPVTKPATGHQLEQQNKQPNKPRKRFFWF